MKKMTLLTFLSMVTGSLVISMELFATSGSVLPESEHSSSHVTSKSDLHTPTYLGLNPDVKSYAQSTNQDQDTFAREHFENFGKQEGRPHLTQEEHARLPDKFNAKGYYHNNKDVKKYASSQNLDKDSFAMYHYLKHGKSEGRQFEYSPKSETTPSTTTTSIFATPSNGKEKQSANPAAVRREHAGESNDVALADNPGESGGGEGVQTGPSQPPEKLTNPERNAGPKRRPPANVRDLKVETKDPYKAAGSKSSEIALPENASVSGGAGGAGSAAQKKGMGYGVSLGTLTARGVETPAQKMDFVREKMKNFASLDERTKRQVEGKLASLLRDTLKPEDNDYQEFKRYEESLKEAAKPGTQQSSATPFGTLRKIPPPNKVGNVGTGSTSTQGSQ